jgi:pimeloyl-ACP methyl ester carboxylesterase
MERPEPPLIFCSGLAADARVFAPQKLAFPHLIVPRWPTPQTAETLDTYCERLAAELGPLDRPVIGGASFGGIIALHLAQYIQPRAVILIGSVPRPDHLPRWIRAARWLRPFVRFTPVRLLQWLMRPLSVRWIRRRAPHLVGVLDQFLQADPTVFCWSVQRLLGWSVVPELNCPVFHIHGARDFVLPPRYTNPDELIARGGHVISLTHSHQVNEFIRIVLARCKEHLTNCR